MSKKFTSTVNSYKIYQFRNKVLAISVMSKIFTSTVNFTKSTNLETRFGKRITKITRPRPWTLFSLFFLLVFLINFDLFIFIWDHHPSTLPNKPHLSPSPNFPTKPPPLMLMLPHQKNSSSTFLIALFFLGLAFFPIFSSIYHNWGYKNKIHLVEPSSTSLTYHRSLTSKVRW